ncbi:MAG TPA: NAD-dependent epimerase/dehydratase family protein [Candidatus Sulfotelmatobacter sp.]|nr:NAD-dependent epimerase/dehydratase family protein [Candidatus Sulfotelmatobacter sp.]
MNLRGHRVLVTGAGGFVGGWVSEALHLSRWADVRAGIGRWTSAVRIARFPLEIVPCDVLDPAALAGALDGVDSVVHCARAADPRVTIDGTRLLLKTAQAAGVRRVVYLSSVAVYGDADGIVDETTPARGVPTPYARSKLEAEALCREAAAAGLEVVILRPTLIYGPFGETWTIAYATRLASGRWRSLGDAGAGRCNLLYVGDLVRAIQRALVAPIEPGAAFNVNGPEIPTWNEYFERFNSVLTGRALATASARQSQLEVMMSRPVRALGKYVLKHHRPLLIGLSVRSRAVKAALKRAETTLRMVPSPDEAKLFRLDAIYSIARARTGLGFEPTTTLDRGLALSAAWLTQNGLVAPRAGSAAERPAPVAGATAYQASASS